jgi:hypothetical protein
MTGAVLTDAGQAMALALRYEHFDFIPSPVDPMHVLMLVKDIRSAVGR